MKYKGLSRIWHHLIIPPWRVGSYFSPAGLSQIEAAITEAERTHKGEIRFVVECSLDNSELFHNVTAKARAIEVFSRIHMWDTEHNNGVLIYLLLADRDVEIVADRGIHQHVGHNGWEAICKEMEAMFRRGEFEAGVLLGIDKISATLQTHYPSSGKSKNELSNKPLIL